MDQLNDFLLLLRHFFVYLFRRSRQVYIFSYIFIQLVIDFIVGIKGAIVRRMFWGRSAFYKFSFQFIIIAVTVMMSLGGVSDRLGLFGATGSRTTFAAESFGYTDILSQAGLTRTVVSSGYIQNNSIDKVKYVVTHGDTLSTIAQKYGVSSDTIRWANDLSNDVINPGQELIIFKHDGVLHTVKDGDTLDSIAEEYKASAQTIAQINWLEQPFVLTSGMELFIPNGTITPPPPAPSAPVVAWTPPPAPTQTYVPSPSGNGLATGTFIRPTEPGCGVVTQWFSAWHDAIDIAQNGGCKLVADDGGVVTSARWTPGGGGFCVSVDHQNGYVSSYCHGNGTFYVSEGQMVSQGQPLMYMGCTGICTGTHVHFFIQYNGVSQNPANYIAF